MTYDTGLEQRLDRIAPQLGTFAKRKMFGGVGYLLNGNMAFGIHKQSLVVRNSPEQAEALLKRDFVSVFDMTGRPMKGWLMVSCEGVKTDQQLSDFVDRAVDYAKGLPPK